MKNLKNFKFLFILVAFLLFGGVIKVKATDYVAMFDEMFSSNTFTIYTNATINDDNSLSTAVNVALSNYYYWENDDTYYNINFYNCRYSNMTCENFYVYRSNPSEEIKTYQNIVINVVSDLD